MSAEAVRAAVSERFPDAAVDGAGSESMLEPATNEFVIFSKPELGRLDERDRAALWDLFARSFADYGVTVDRLRVLTGSELDRTGVMAQHYGVINQISRLGRPALTEAAEQALQDLLGDQAAEAAVLGGHQFLDHHAEFSPFTLGILFANAKVTRLGPGTYAATVRIDGDPVTILNGFHPRQLSFFTARDTVCAFLHASSGTDWEVLRSELIGATDPSQAKQTSIRGTLYADPGAFGLSTVSSNFNGVHMSAGPLEGLGELDRFFGDGRPVTDWAFARALLDAGATADDVTAFLRNPVIETDGKRGTAFDLTEGCNASPAAQLLALGERAV
jgi:hypothetical protein